MANPNTKIKKSENKTFQEGLKEYFKGVKAEWGKVTWPEKQQIVVETGIVLFVVITFTVAVFVIDKVFGFVLGLIP